MVFAYLVHQIAIDPEYMAQMSLEKDACLAKTNLRFDPDAYHALCFIEKKTAGIWKLLNDTESVPDEQQ